MDRYSLRTIELTNKVNMPRDIIAKMGLQERPEFYLYPAGNLLILQKYSKPNVPEHAVTVKLDELKRITIPEEVLVDKMNWRVGNNVSFYYVDEEMAIIKLNVFD